MFWFSKDFQEENQRTDKHSLNEKGVIKTVWPGC